MSRALVKQAGMLAGYLAIPLIIVLAIGFISVRRFDWYIIVGLIVLILAITFFAATNPSVWQRPLGRQRVSSTISGIVVIIALCGIVYLTNILVKPNAARLDFTSTQAFTLSDTSVKVVQSLRDPVAIRVFYDRNSQAQQQQAQELLKQYTARTDKINVQTINANIEPLTVQQFGVKTVPSIVFVQGSRQEIVTTLDEQGFTRALLQVQNPSQRRVLVVTGHQELPTQASQDGNSIATAIQALTTNNYKVELYNSLTGTSSPLGEAAATPGQQQPPIPTQTRLDPANDILLIAGPRGRFNDQEKTQLGNFLKQGGKALIAYDVTTSVSPNPTSNTNVNDLLTDFGLSFKQGVVVETRRDRITQAGAVFLIPEVVADSPLARELGSDQLIVAPLSVAVEKGANATGTFGEALRSSSESYLETDLAGLATQRSEFTQNADVRGPIVLGATYEEKARQPVGAAPAATPGAATTPGATPAATGATEGQNTRLVLLGSATLMSDAALSNLRTNYDVFINAMNYLNGNVNNVVIPAKLADSKPFALNDNQATITKLSAIVGLPLLILFLGVVGWWRRR